jgi:predicted O-linked N-acetylglucosamine transferase (SPINDLY family)
MIKSQKLIINQALSHAKRLTKKGLFSEALQVYNNILLREPHNSIAKKNLHKLQKKVPSQQNVPTQEQTNQLIQLYNSGNMEEVESVCKKMLTIYPKSLMILNILGGSLNRQGKLQEAIYTFTQAIKLKPDYVDAYYNRGVAFQGLNQPKEAIKNYDKTIQLKSDYVNAYYNRGVALQELNQLEEAVKNYDKAIEIKPDFFDAYNNRGNIFKDVGKYQDAVKSYNKVIQLNPDYVEAYSNKGLILQSLGKLKDAIQSFEDVIQQNPHYVDAYTNLFLTLNYCPELSESEIYQKHLEFEKQFGRHSQITDEKKIKKVKNSKLRVGYLSADFRQHSVAYFFEPLLKSHDKTLIDIYCYYNNTKIDDTTKSLMNEANHWRSIIGLNDKAVVELIRKDNIDILVDLSGHTSDNRLKVFTYKPALIQVSWLGYPNTTGLSAIDYRFTDSIADPVGTSDKCHSEQLIRLPNGFLCYRGNDSIPEQRTLPSIKRGYITFGCFNDFAKVNFQVIKLWSKILRAVPNSHLILKARQLVDPEIKSGCLELFNKEGIDSDRIEFYSTLSKTEDHLALYNSIDIALDPFPYNGTTTTCEALWMGVPTITLKGSRHASRVGASIMTHVGLEEFIVESEQEYIETAVKLTENTVNLAKIRSGLRQQMKNSVLCDEKLFTRNIEKIYFKLYKKYDALST